MRDFLEKTKSFLSGVRILDTRRIGNGFPHYVLHIKGNVAMIYVCPEEQMTPEEQEFILMWYSAPLYRFDDGDDAYRFIRHFALKSPIQTFNVKRLKRKPIEKKKKQKTANPFKGFLGQQLAFL